MLRTIIMCCVLLAIAMPAAASTRLKNICRVKGQEENVLRGMGLVVGLNGTGEANDGPTMRAIARAMEIMGNPLTMNGQQTNLEELRRMKNAALNGKSLEGGRLAFASLQGPNTQDPRVYALCQGQLTIDNPEQPMVGIIHGGCQMEADIFTPFWLQDSDGGKYITLVLDKNHANFQTAAEIARLIYEQMSNLGIADGKNLEEMVWAIDAANIKVRIPKMDEKDPVGFTAALLDSRIEEPEPESRVVVNSRAGTIVISGEVEIGDVLVTHKNITVEAISSPALAAVDIDESNRAKLDQLVNQLNSLKVPPEDMIEIIRGIERNGKLHGQLIIDR